MRVANMVARETDPRTVSLYLVGDSENNAPKRSADLREVDAPADQALGVQMELGHIQRLDRRYHRPD